MKKTTIYFYIASALMAIVVLDVLLWIEVSSDMSKSFEDVVKEYNSYFPSFLDTRYGVTFLNSIFLVISGVLFFMAEQEKRFRIISIVSLSFCIILLLWQMWTLL